MPEDDEQTVEEAELDDMDEVGSHNLARFIRMGFEELEAIMLVHAGAHPTEVELRLRQGCPRHVALKIWL
jgi:hypothetical protein